LSLGGAHPVPARRFRGIKRLIGAQLLSSRNAIATPMLVVTTMQRSSRLRIKCWIASLWLSDALIL
jgi:hypothetical protein